MKIATTVAAMMIAGMLPLASASQPASAKVFDWSLTGTLPSLGGVPFPGSGTIDASPTESTGVWSIDGHYRSHQWQRDQHQRVCVHQHRGHLV